MLAGKFGVPGYSDKIEQAVDGAFGSPYLQSNPIDDIQISQWIQLSGFLIATLGPYSRSPVLESPLLAAAEYMLGYALQDISKMDMASLCLKDMVNLLDSEHHRIRDAMRELLASDLEASFLSAIIEIFRPTLESFLEFGRLETASSEVTLFFDQSLVVISGLLCRSQPDEDNGFDRSHVEDHLLAAAYYVNKQEHSSSCTRLKIQICKAAEALYSRSASSKDLTTSSGASRNSLSRYLLLFAEEALTSTNGKSSHELEEHASAALEYCLKGLILRRPGEGKTTTDIRLVSAYCKRLAALIEVCKGRKVNRCLLACAMSDKPARSLQHHPGLCMVAQLAAYRRNRFHFWLDTTNAKKSLWQPARMYCWRTYRRARPW